MDPIPDQATRDATTKSGRRRLVKAELLLHLAMSAQRWADDLDGTSHAKGECLPVEEWPPDDPMRILIRTYGLTAKDVAKVCVELADEMEHRSERAGYEDHWDHIVPGVHAKGPTRVASR